MFIDRAIVEVRSGKGGDGMIAFLREKYVPKGGPAGGNGGRGGSIYFRAKKGINTLFNFRHSRVIIAEDGGKGLTKNKYGRGASDVYIDVPIGTIVFEEKDHKFLGDLTKDGDTIMVAKGGRGGRGNAAFKSSRNRVPNVSENGLPGENKRLILELKLLADVGLVGLPNAGKSTFLSVISRANPLIANYPFTTLEPNLGVVDDDPDNAFVVADLPGLIEGAHEGKGLGLAFLRHLERCRLIAHVVAMDGVNDPYESYKSILNEIKQYGVGLENRPSIVIASKMDVEGAAELLEQFKKQVKVEVFPISSWEHSGLTQIIKRMRDILSITPMFPSFKEEVETIKVYDAHKDEEAIFTVTREKEHVFRISGERVERTANLINLSTDEGMIKLLTYLRKIDVEKELIKKGATDGDTVILNDFEFEFLE